MLVLVSNDSFAELFDKLKAMSFANIHPQGFAECLMRYQQSCIAEWENYRPALPVPDGFAARMDILRDKCTLILWFLGKYPINGTAKRTARSLTELSQRLMVAAFPADNAVQTERFRTLYETCLRDAQSENNAFIESMRSCFA